MVEERLSARDEDFLFIDGAVEGLKNGAVVSLS